MALSSFHVETNEASRSKSPTRQSRYGDGALQGIRAKVNKNFGITNCKSTLCQL